MNDRFKRVLTISTSAHVLVVLMIVVLPMISRWVRPREVPEMISFIDLVQPMPEIPQPVKTPETPPKKEEPPEPPKKPIVPEEVKKPPEKPKVQVNTNLVRRPVAPAPKKPALTPEEIKKLLAAGLPQRPGPVSQSGEVSDLSWYFALVRATMYEAWDQPSSLTATAGWVTRVSIRVERNGAIAARKLLRSSGNKVMDDSVMKAVQSVSQLRALPPEISGSSLDITIDFELTGAL